MDATESAALRQLGERDIWGIDELPPGIDADMLRCLDAEGMIEVRFVVMQNQQQYRGDKTPPLPTPSAWFSPIKQPRLAGDWDRISSRTKRDEQHHPPEVHVTDRGKAELSRLQRSDSQLASTDRPWSQEEWESALLSAHDVVRRDPECFRGAGQWLDTEYSESAVRSRRRMSDEGETTGHVSAPLMPGVAEGKDTRFWRLNCVSTDWQADPPDLSMRSLEDIELWARRVLLYVALVTDRDAGDYASALTELATLSWDGEDEEYNLGRGWCEPDDVWEAKPPWPELVSRSLELLKRSDGGGSGESSETETLSPQPQVESPADMKAVAEEGLALVEPSVVLTGRSDAPLVCGVQKPVLSDAQYDVLVALIAAGDKGLTKDAMVRNSGRGDPRGILARLRRDPDWARCLPAPGRPGVGYRVLHGQNLS